MSYKWNKNCIEDNYNKYVCNTCGKAFIVGEDNKKDCNLTCPYCQSNQVDWYASIDEKNIEESGGLGCAGIYVEKAILRR